MLLEHLEEIRKAVKPQKVADILQAHIIVAQHLTGFLNFQSVDVLHRGLTGQLLKLLAVNRLTHGTAFGKLRNVEPVCVVPVNIIDTALIRFMNGEQLTEQLIHFGLKIGKGPMFIQLRH